MSVARRHTGRPTLALACSALMAGLGAGCSSVSGAAPPTATPSPAHASASPSASARRTVVMGFPSSSQTVELRRGEMLTITGVAADDRIDADPNILRAVSASPSPSAGDAGKRTFEAIAPGKTQLVLTHPARPCPPSEPCPPAALEATAEVEVRP